MPRATVSANHDGVSCDSCMAANFSGDRFKCLRCYDFDLCRDCFENTRFGNASDHTSEHPMQCMMTQHDFELAYGGEPQPNYNDARILTFVCPHCNTRGLNHASLFEHVTRQHSNVVNDVICPLCLSSLVADPNRIFDDLASHMVAHHSQRDDRSGSARPGAGLDDEWSGSTRATGRRQLHTRQNARRSRVFGSGTTGVATAPNSRAGGAIASQQMNPGGNANPASVTSIASSVDPIAELLSQLGGIRRTHTNYSATLAQIQQLGQQIGTRITLNDAVGVTTRANVGGASGDGARAAVAATVDAPGHFRSALNQTFDMLGSSGFLDQGGFSSSTAAAVRSSLYESPSSWSEVVSGRGGGEAVGEVASVVNASPHTLLPFAPPIPFLRVAASPTESTLNGGDHPNEEHEPPVNVPPSDDVGIDVDDETVDLIQVLSGTNSGAYAATIEGSGVVPGGYWNDTRFLCTNSRWALQNSKDTMGPLSAEETALRADFVAELILDLCREDVDLFESEGNELQRAPFNRIEESIARQMTGNLPQTTTTTIEAGADQAGGGERVEQGTRRDD